MFYKPHSSNILYHVFYIKILRIWVPWWLSWVADFVSDHDFVGYEFEAHNQLRADSL